MDHLLFAILASYLHPPSVFILSEALCLREWPTDLTASMRGILRVPRTVSLPRFLSTYLDRPRCRRCGCASHTLPPRYCRACSNVVFISRQEILRTLPRPRRILLAVRRQKRRQTGAYLYWRWEVEATVSLFKP